jgi:hypothetical protein
MLHLDGGIVVLFVIALLAAFVNGALGYGFSSLTSFAAYLVGAAYNLLRIAKLCPV